MPVLQRFQPTGDRSAMRAKSCAAGRYDRVVGTASTWQSPHQHRSDPHHSIWSTPDKMDNEGSRSSSAVAATSGVSRIS